MKTLIAACLLATTALSQIPEQKLPGPDFYRLDYVIRELDAGKVVSTRSYSTLATPHQKSVIRMGDRLPVPVNKDGSLTYLDAGVNIESTVERATDNRISLSVSADVSNAVNQATTPILRNARWTSWVIVPLRKPTIIYSSDATTDKKQMQLELTVTPIQ